MAEQPSTREPYVFLSYTTPDRARVLALADRLEASGIRVWVDRRDIVGGSRWDTSIVHAIANCTVFALTCSFASLVSPNVQQEVRLAWEEGRPILPLLLEPVAIPADLRYPLAGRQWVELLDRTEAAWLPDVLRALAGFGLIPVPQVAPTSNPAAPVLVRLPTPLTSFIGREQELAAVTALLGTTRLLTLTGSGGTGKTRLAIEVGARLAGLGSQVGASPRAYPDGVCFVALAPISDQNLVASAIAQSLGVREAPGMPIAESLQLFLREKHMLLLLDNFEQVIEAASLVSELLTACPGLTLLVTSRVRLRVSGEHDFAVPPLRVPDPAHLPPLEQFTQYEAVRLFAERAQAGKHDFAVRGEDAAAVAEICARLDGLPLAIELAAARIRLLTPDALLARLGNRLTLLSGGARDVPARQQTLRSAIAWSYDLLTAGEQALFRRLSVFAGGCTLEAIEAVFAAGAAPTVDVLDAVASLIDKSLLRQEPRSKGPARFGMLETIREFGLECLEASSEAAVVKRQHAMYFLSLVEEADHELTTEASEAHQYQAGAWRQYLQRLTPEQENVRAALQWALQQQEVERALHAVGGLWYWYWLQGPAEGRRWAGRLLAAAPAAQSTLAEAKGLSVQGFLAWVQGDYLTARRMLLENVPKCREAGEGRWLGLTLVFLGLALQAEPASGRPVIEECIQLCQARGDRWLLALARIALGILARETGDLENAASALADAVAFYRAIGEGPVLAVALYNRGRLAFLQGDFALARSQATESLAIYRAVGAMRNAALVLTDLGHIAQQEGDVAGATKLFVEALQLSRQVGYQDGIADSLEGLAWLWSHRGSPERAARLFGAGKGLRSTSGAPLLAPYRALHEGTRVALQDLLGEDAFALAAAQGQSMALEEAIALAVED